MRCWPRWWHRCGGSWPRRWLPRFDRAADKRDVINADQDRHRSIGILGNLPERVEHDLGPHPGGTSSRTTREPMPESCTFSHHSVSSFSTAWCRADRRVISARYGLRWDYPARRSTNRSTWSGR